MSTEIYTLQTIPIKSSGLFWEAILLVIRFSSQVKNIVWPITNPIRLFFTSEENRIGFYRHFISLVAVNTNTALPWRIFWNVKRRIQDTKKTSKSECKTTKYQETKQHKHNNRLCEGKPCKWSSQNFGAGLKSFLKSDERTFPVSWLHLSSFLTFCH